MLVVKFVIYVYSRKRFCQCQMEKGSPPEFEHATFQKGMIFELLVDSKEAIVREFIDGDRASLNICRIETIENN